MTIAPLSAETIKNFLYASTATVSMQMLKRGFRNTAVNGARPVNPKAAKLIGPAYTLRYVPGREDLDQPPKPSDSPSAQRQAIEETPAGHVLVIGTEGSTSAGTLGDILALRLKVRGVAGVLSDGAMRDTPVIGKMDFPVFCTAAAAPPSMTSLHPAETQTPVGICGVAVYPGDVIVADEDGAIVVPSHLADEVARDSFEQERLEKFVAIRVAQGEPIPGTYPPNDETRALYQDWIKAGEPSTG
ncbi:MAG: ribonuclease activity regulator RraA [Alphaproteobacteria bacterium]|nr:ribonuclease activity regulator RraA [Alphaproteobacteria bacterium]MBV8408080.1 ribonuclease activity regulator RraA [Alphaproteobacteria bacterium]